MRLMTLHITKISFLSSPKNSDTQKIYKPVLWNFSDGKTQSVFQKTRTPSRIARDNHEDRADPIHPPIQFHSQPRWIHIDYIQPNIDSHCSTRSSNNKISTNFSNILSPIWRGKIHNPLTAPRTSIKSPNQRWWTEIILYIK